MSRWYGKGKIGRQTNRASLSGGRSRWNDECTLLGRTVFLAIDSLALRSWVTVSIASGYCNRVEIHILDTPSDGVSVALNRSAGDNGDMKVNFLGGRFSVGVFVLVVVLARLLIGFGNTLGAARQRQTRRDRGVASGDHLTFVVRVFLRHVTSLVARRFGGVFAFSAVGWGGVISIVDRPANRRRRLATGRSFGDNHLARRGLRSATATRGLLLKLVNVFFDGFNAEGLSALSGRLTRDISLSCSWRRRFLIYAGVCRFGV